MRDDIKSYGFTLIEVIVVIVVLGVLAGVTALNYGQWKQQTIAAQLKNDINGVMTAMDDYRNFNNIYPTSIPSSFTPSDGASLTLVTISDVDFCIEAVNSSYPTMIYYYDTRQNIDPSLGECN